MIDRKLLRESRRILRDDNAKYGAEPEIVPEDQWPQDMGNPRPLQVWRSYDFLIRIFPEDMGAARITVNRARLDDNGDWMDGISWDQLQSIKNRCGFADREAMEIYPVAGSEVKHNMRHLWVMPEWMKIRWTWRGKNG
jgi:hypothetical protein